MQYPYRDVSILRTRPRPRSARGVSPIIAMILLVAIVVVLAAVLYVMLVGLVHGPNPPPIGGALAVGQPAAGECWAAGVTNHVCGTAGDRLWNLTIEHSDVKLGDILIEVRTASGAVFDNSRAGGFAVILPGVATPIAYYSVAAGAGLAMKSGFTYASGYTVNTPMTSVMYLVVGTGTPVASWTPGQGNYVSIVGMNHYSGETMPADLP
jgi:flagellin-like protein